MPRAVLTVAEVFRRYGDTFRAEVGAALSTAHSRVMTAIEQCRTAALGGHVEQCDHCGHRRVWYNSCRNRHCPTCQSLARATWLERRRADLLPTEYFHVVFTVPPAIAEIAAQNKAVVYGLLFRTVAETLRTIAADPRHLGAELGFFAVLHTWGQTLVHHPHLHCVIPGGGLASDGSGWVACRPGFFLPVRVLSRYFRRVLLAALEDAFESEQLRFAGVLQPLSDPRCFAEHLRPARETEWVVYAKRPFAGPEQVLDYLGRYTHRIAISNQRLCSLHDDSVRFRYTDYRRAGASRKKTMTLTATEFIRRMLLHVLPPGFHRIRHYGFLANRNRQQKLTECRRLLCTPPPAAEAGPVATDYREGAALLRWRPNQSLRRRRGRRQLDPSRRGEERQRVRWPTVLLSSATDGGLPLVLARFVRGLSTHQDSGCLRRLRTAATAAKCHRAPVDSHRVADQMPTGPSMSRRRAPHAASPLPRG